METSTTTRVFFPTRFQFYVGRNLARVFREAGLVDLQIRSFARTRIGPFKGTTRTFLRAYLNELRDRVIDRLESAEREDLIRLVGENSSEYLLSQLDIQLTVTDHMIEGRVALTKGELKAVSH